MRRATVGALRGHGRAPLCEMQVNLQMLISSAAAFGTIQLHRKIIDSVDGG